MRDMTLLGLRQQAIEDVRAAKLLVAMAARQPVFQLALARIWNDPHVLAGALHEARQMSPGAVRKKVRDDDLAHQNALEDQSVRRRREREAEVWATLKNPEQMNQLIRAAERLPLKEELNT